MATKITYSGPLFDGQLPQRLAKIGDDVAERLGKEALRRWQGSLNASLHRPTGAYFSRTQLYGPVAGQARTHDNQSVYGPWLEGTGSRNATTRFKGYASARRAFQQIEMAAPHLAEQVIREHLAELGG